MRVRPLQRQDAEVVADVLDHHFPTEVPRHASEVAQRRLGGGEQVFVLVDVQDHTVLQHEAALVAPARVLRPPDVARTDVACQDPLEESSRIGSADAVLEER